MIESDFYSTAAGREHFRNQLQSIRYCVQEVRFEAARTRRRRPRSRPPRRAQTCNFDVLYAYLTCTNCAPRAEPRLRRPSPRSPRRSLRVRRRLPLYASPRVLWPPPPTPFQSHPSPSFFPWPADDIQKGCALVQLAILAAPPRRRVLTRLVPPTQSPPEAQRAHGDGARHQPVRDCAEGGPWPGQVHRDGQGAHGAVPGHPEHAHRAARAAAVHRDVVGGEVRVQRGGPGGPGQVRGGRGGLRVARLPRLRRGDVDAV